MLVWKSYKILPLISKSEFHTPEISDKYPTIKMVFGDKQRLYSLNFDPGLLGWIPGALPSEITALHMACNGWTDGVCGVAIES